MTFHSLQEMLPRGKVVDFRIINNPILDNTE